MKIIWNKNTLLLRQRQNQQRRLNLIKTLQSINIEVIKQRIKKCDVIDCLIHSDFDLIDLGEIKSSFSISIENKSVIAKEILK